MTIAVPNLRAVICAPRWARNELWKRAAAYPSLDLQFADRKSLVDAISGSNLITFTRSGDATYVDSDGLIKTAGTNVPRFDHNPTTGECLGLLVEEQRTNLLLRSEEFDHASWSKAASTTVANAIVAPNGSTVAEKLVEDATTNLHYIFQIISVIAGTSYTVSVYAKAAERSEIYVDLTTFNSAFLSGSDGYFNLSNGTVRLQGANATARISSAGNGWYRCSVTATAQATVTAVINSGATSNGTTFFYAGDGTSGIYLWGAQLEAGASPTSYIPTTTSAVTRNADVASITGTNFSSWYWQDEGSFYCSTFAPKGDIIFGTGDTFDNTQYAQVAAPSSFSTYFRAGGANQALLSMPGSSTLNTSFAMAYATDSFAAVSNGGTVSTDSSGSVPANQVRLKLGSSAWDTGGTNSINGTIRRLTYWPSRLTNATLQAITQ